MMPVFHHDGLALGEWLSEEYDRPLAWACVTLFDQARIDCDLRPGSLGIFPTRGAHWAGMATAAAIDLRADVARALACPPHVAAPMPRAPAIVLHEAGHVAILLLAPAALSSRLAAVAPTLAAGSHDPVFAALVGVFYLRAGVPDAVDPYYDCGWSSEGAYDWPGPDWSLDWAHDFAQRHAGDEGGVADLLDAAIREFESEYFSRERKARRWWTTPFLWGQRRLGLGNTFHVAANWRRHR